MDNQIKHTALELLLCVRALQSDIREVLMLDGGLDHLKHEPGPIFIIDVLEENGVDYTCFIITFISMHLYNMFCDLLTT